MEAEWLGEADAHPVVRGCGAREARDVPLDVAARAEEVGDYHHLPGPRLCAGSDGFRDGRAGQRQVGNPNWDASEPPGERSRHLRELLVGGGLAAAVIQEDEGPFVEASLHQ